jgi:HEAT repeat protein
MKQAAKAGTKGSAVDKLINGLRESDDFARAKIVDEIVSAPSKPLIERVARLLDEKKTSVRMDALDILRRTGKDYIDVVIQLLYHPNDDVRVYACEVLSTLKHPASLPYLIEKVHDHDENVRNAAVMALGEFEDDRAVDVLLEVLELEQWVAFSAVYSLEKIGKRRAVPALLNVFKNREEELSLAACEALIRFRDDKTVDEIVGFVSQLAKEREKTFIKVIIEQGDVQVFEKLAQRMGEALLHHLLDYIRTERRKSRKAVRFLVYFKHRDSAKAMLEILKDMDPDGDEYEGVLKLFMELKDVWGQNVEQYLGNEEYMLPLVRACGGLGCKVDDEVLLGVFRSCSLETKREIMRQLSRICDGNGYRIIREAMQDSDGHVQAEAVAVAGNMALQELSQDVIRMAKNGYTDVRTKALIALLRLDRVAALDLIGSFVRNGDSEDKRVYLSVTSHLDAETNYPFLKDLIADPDGRIRQITIRVIGNFIEEEKYLDLFRAALKSGDIPNEVLKIVGEKKLTGFKKLLMDIFADPLQTSWTRYHSLVALAGFGDASLFQIFIDSLKDKDNLIKIGGLKALSELNDKKAIPHIRPYTKSNDEDVKTAARMALGRLSQSEALC